MERLGKIIPIPPTPDPPLGKDIEALPAQIMLNFGDRMVIYRRRSAAEAEYEFGSYLPQDS